MSQQDFVIEDSSILPEECPVCEKKTKNILLHISKKKTCCSQIDPKMYEHWKILANKRTKRKYKENNRVKLREAQAKYVKDGKHKQVQARYVDAGKHKKAQAKYEQKFSNICKKCEKVPFFSSKKMVDNPMVYQFREDCKCPPDDRESFLKTKRRNQSKSRNRDEIRCGGKRCGKRLESFMKLCIQTLWCLKRGKIGTFRTFNKFHLVESEVVLEHNSDEEEEDEDIDDDDDRTHSWLSEVDGTLLCLVITFQKLVLVTKSKWIRATEEVQTKKDKIHLSDKLYRLIGKLQAYESYEDEKIIDVKIPEKFVVRKVVDDPDWKFPGKIAETLTKEDESVLIDILYDIVGEEYVDEELEELLGIYNDLLNVEVALSYTKR